VRLNDLAELQKTKRQDLATNRLELTRYQNTAEKQAALAVAKSKKEDRIIALDESKTQGLAISEAWTAKKKLLDDQIEEQGGKLRMLTTSIDATASISLAAVDSGIEKTTHEIHEAEQAISETSTLIAKLQGELEGMADAEEQLRKTNEDKIRANAGIADWTYIRNACGKNGLQALEIDATAPLISSFANDLLAKAFGPLFTVKLLTQDDEGKECLDIVVIGDDGDEIHLENLSGGQKVWLLMALRLAMTVLSKEKSGNNFLTAFSDESDGPLDSDNAVNYVSMYRSFMNIGGFENFLFISHRPECRHMADHVLNFEKDKNPYWN
jgi:exonuclease SbcC